MYKTDKSLVVADGLCFPPRCLGFEPRKSVVAQLEDRYDRPKLAVPLSYLQRLLPYNGGESKDSRLVLDTKRAPS
jgi:hypothetical protein